MKKRWRSVFAMMLAGSLAIPTSCLGEASSESMPEAQAAQVLATETQAAEAQAAQGQPTEIQAAEAQAAQGQPTEAQASEAQAAQGQPTEIQAAETGAEISAKRLAQAGGEADIWLRLESTNMDALAPFRFLKSSFSFQTDGELGRADMDLEYGDTHLLSGSIFIKGEDLFISMPELTDTVFTMSLSDYGAMPIKEAGADEAEAVAEEGAGADGAEAGAGEAVGTDEAEAGAEEAAVAEEGAANEEKEDGVEEGESPEPRKGLSLNPFQALLSGQEEGSSDEAPANTGEGTLSGADGERMSVTETRREPLAGITEPQPEKDPAADNGEASADASGRGSLSVLDYEALAERYQNYCGKTIESLKASIETEDGEESIVRIDGMDVTCTVEKIIIPKEDILRLADATLDFTIRDEECRGLLKIFLGSRVVPETDAGEFREKVYSSLDENLSDICVINERTPEGELAARRVSMDSGNLCVDYTRTNRGGESLDENCAWQLAVSNEDGDRTFSLTRDVEHDGTISVATYTAEWNTPRTASEPDDSALGIRPDDSVRDIEPDDSSLGIGPDSIQNIETDTNACALNLVVSHDEASGGYTLSGALEQEGRNVLSATSYGTVGEAESGFSVDCEDITLIFGGKYVALSAGVSGKSLTSDLLPEEFTEKALLDLAEATNEELTAEEGTISANLEMILKVFSSAFPDSWNR